MLPVTISKIKSLSENKERKQVEPVAQLHITSAADWPKSRACLLGSVQAPQTLHCLAKRFFLLYGMLTLNSISTEARPTPKRDWTNILLPRSRHNTAERNEVVRCTITGQEGLVEASDTTVVLAHQLWPWCLPFFVVTLLLLGVAIASL